MNEPKNFPDGDTNAGSDTDAAKPNREDPIAGMIDAALDASGTRGVVDPGDIARAYAASVAKPTTPKDAWTGYTKRVRAIAIGMARQGRIVILRKGKPVDPHAPIKGLIRLARPKAD